MAAAVGWALAMPLAPFAASHASPAPFWYAAAFVLYGAGSVVCHQLPDRSFQLWSAQLPVCARCAGIYAGAAAAAVVAATWKRRRAAGAAVVHAALRRLPALQRLPALRVSALAIAAVPTAATLLYEWIAGEAPSNSVRAFTGVPLGAAFLLLVVNALADQASEGAGAARAGCSQVR
jgi:uncharacterized membrane protein